MTDQKEQTATDFSQNDFTVPEAKSVVTPVLPTPKLEGFTTANDGTWPQPPEGNFFRLDPAI